VPANAGTNSVGVQNEGTAAEGGYGEFRLARTEAKPRRLARSEQTAKEKFCFPFRRKRNRAPNQKIRRKLFFVGASVSERRRAERQNSQSGFCSK